MSIEAESIAQKRGNRFKKRLRKRGKALIKSLNCVIAGNSLIPVQPIYDCRDFTWTVTLKSNFHVIQRELDHILERREDLPVIYDLQAEQYRISSDRKWKLFPLFGWGFQLSEGARICPQTTRMVKTIPGLQTASFSILDPGAHIPEHRGHLKGLLRGHLAMTVPRDRQSCVMFIDGEPYHWDEGQMIIFDDTYRHEVRNETDEERIVLLFHFDRPMAPLGSLIHGVIMFGARRTGFVRQARRNYERWARRYREIRA